MILKLILNVFFLGLPINGLKKVRWITDSDEHSIVDLQNAFFRSKIILSSLTVEPKMEKLAGPILYQINQPISEIIISEQIVKPLVSGNDEFFSDFFGDSELENKMTYDDYVNKFRFQGRLVSPLTLAESFISEIDGEKMGEKKFMINLKTYSFEKIPVGIGFSEDFVTMPYSLTMTTSAALKPNEEVCLFSDQSDSEKIIAVFQEVISHPVHKLLAVCYSTYNDGKSEKALILVNQIVSSRLKTSPIRTLEPLKFSCYPPKGELLEKYKGHQLRSVILGNEDNLINDMFFYLVGSPIIMLMKKTNTYLFDVRYLDPIKFYNYPIKSMEYKFSEMLIIEHGDDPKNNAKASFVSLVKIRITDSYIALKFTNRTHYYVDREDRNSRFNPLYVLQSCLKIYHDTNDNCTLLKFEGNYLTSYASLNKPTIYFLEILNSKGHIEIHNFLKQSLRTYKVIEITKIKNVVARMPTDNFIITLSKTSMNSEGYIHHKILVSDFEDFDFFQEINLKVSNYVWSNLSTDGRINLLNYQYDYVSGILFQRKFGSIRAFGIMIPSIIAARNKNFSTVAWKKSPNYNNQDYCGINQKLEFKTTVESSYEVLFCYAEGVKFGDSFLTNETLMLPSIDISLKAKKSIPQIPLSRIVKGSFLTLESIPGVQGTPGIVMKMEQFSDKMFKINFRNSTKDLVINSFFGNVFFSNVLRKEVLMIVISTNEKNLIFEGNYSQSGTGNLDIPNLGGTFTDFRRIDAILGFTSNIFMVQIDRLTYRAEFDDTKFTLRLWKGFNGNCDKFTLIKMRGSGNYMLCLLDHEFFIKGVDINGQDWSRKVLLSEQLDRHFRYRNTTVINIFTNENQRSSVFIVYLETNRTKDSQTRSEYKVLQTEISHNEEFTLDSFMHSNLVPGGISKLQDVKSAGNKLIWLYLKLGEYYIDIFSMDSLEKMSSLEFPKQLRFMEDSKLQVAFTKNEEVSQRTILQLQVLDFKVGVLMIDEDRERHLCVFSLEEESLSFAQLYSSRNKKMEISKLSTILYLNQGLIWRSFGVILRSETYKEEIIVDGEISKKSIYDYFLMTTTYSNNMISFSTDLDVEDTDIRLASKFTITSLLKFKDSSKQIMIRGQSIDVKFNFRNNEQPFRLVGEEGSIKKPEIVSVPVLGNSLASITRYSPSQFVRGNLFNISAYASSTIEKDLSILTVPEFFQKTPFEIQNCISSSPVIDYEFANGRGIAANTLMINGQTSTAILEESKWIYQKLKTREKCTIIDIDKIGKDDSSLSPPYLHPDLMRFSIRSVEVVDNKNDHRLVNSLVEIRMEDLSNRTAKKIYYDTIKDYIATKKAEILIEQIKPRERYLLAIYDLSESINIYLSYTLVLAELVGGRFTVTKLAREEIFSSKFDASFIRSLENNKIGYLSISGGFDDNDNFRAEGIHTLMKIEKEQGASQISSKKFRIKFGDGSNYQRDYREDGRFDIILPNSLKLDEITNKYDLQMMIDVHSGNKYIIDIRDLKISSVDNYTLDDTHLTIIMNPLVGNMPDLSSPLSLLTDEYAYFMKHFLGKANFYAVKLNKSQGTIFKGLGKLINADSALSTSVFIPISGLKIISDAPNGFNVRFNAYNGSTNARNHQLAYLYPNGSLFLLNFTLDIAIVSKAKQIASHSLVLNVTSSRNRSLEVFFGFGPSSLLPPIGKGLKILVSIAAAVTGSLMLLLLLLKIGVPQKAQEIQKSTNQEIYSQNQNHRKDSHTEDDYIFEEYKLENDVILSLKLGKKITNFAEFLSDESVVDGYLNEAEPRMRSEHIDQNFMGRLLN